MLDLRLVLALQLMKVLYFELCGGDGEGSNSIFRAGTAPSFADVRETDGNESA
jgi:hypothetical protein